MRSLVIPIRKVDDCYLYDWDKPESRRVDPNCAMYELADGRVIEMHIYCAEERMREGQIES